MLKAYFFTTEDFNGMIITDGQKAWEVTDFPQDGTLEDARAHDMSGLEGCQTMDDVKASIGTDLDLFGFNEDEYETIEEIRTI